MKEEEKDLNIPFHLFENLCLAWVIGNLNGNKVVEKFGVYSVKVKVCKRVGIKDRIQNANGLVSKYKSWQQRRNRTSKISDEKKICLKSFAEIIEHAFKLTMHRSNVCY